MTARRTRTSDKKRQDALRLLARLIVDAVRQGKPNPVPAKPRPIHTDRKTGSNT